MLSDIHVLVDSILMIFNQIESGFFLEKIFVMTKIESILLIDMYHVCVCVCRKKFFFLVEKIVNSSKSIYMVTYCSIFKRKKNVKNRFLYKVILLQVCMLVCVCAGNICRFIACFGKLGNN